MSLITVSNLTFKYEGQSENIFEDVSFQFDTDWKLGLVGRNGRGKTTFMKLLMREYDFHGKITSPISFDYFPFAAENPGRAAAEVIAGFNPDCEEWELRRELNLLQLPDDVLGRPFGTLSAGERTKVMIAALFLRRGHFLLFDEPTNHLDYQGKRALAEYMRSKRGFILTSHDRMFLDRTVDHILSINRANIEIRHGNFSQWFANKERQDESERERNRKLKGEITRLKDASRRASNWSDKVEATKIGGGAAKGHIGRLAAKMMKRSKNLEARRNAAAEEKTLLLRNIDESGELKISPMKYHSDTLAEFSGVFVEYAGRRVVRDVNFTVRRGGRVALLGRNGCGKSSLIKLAAGMDIPHGGRARVGSGVKISLVPQETSHLRGSLREFARDFAPDMPLFFAILDRLGVAKGQFETDMGVLSEGQKKKILIARSLSEPAHLYLWDEPLNYVDVQSRIQIERLILKCAPTMLFVEHDEAFVKNIATEEIMLG